jgi:stalled ribosome rescue protein Dom34
MNTKQNLGIWMDHSAAHLINLKDKMHSIHSAFDFDVQEEAIRKNENLMHNKRQQMLATFYKDIAAEVLKYDHVLLFGPTNAKEELYNYLESDTHFNDIQIDVEVTDKMTDNQKTAFVKEHFDQ